MSLWTRIRGLIDQNAVHYSYSFIEEPGSAALKANESYFRIWLREMFLAKSKQWGTAVFPSVTTGVQLRFGDHNGVTLTHVAQAPVDALSRAVAINYATTPLLPFRGGVVEVEGALVALKGDNQLRAAIDAFGDFAGLVAPPVGQALEIANRVAGGVDKVLAAGQSAVHLGIHDSFADGEGVGSRPLRPGYLAVVLAPANQLPAAELRVVDGRLHRARGGGPQPLTEYDFMLYQVEGRATRDDWLLSDIEEPMKKAIEATIKGETQSAEAYKRVALVAALTSSDLTLPDRRRVAQAVKDEIAEAEEMGLGFAPAQRRSLAEAIDTHAMSIDDARNLGPMTIDEALRG